MVAWLQSMEVTKSQTGLSIYATGLKRWHRKQELFFFFFSALPRRRKMHKPIQDTFFFLSTYFLNSFYLLVSYILLNYFYIFTYLLFTLSTFYLVDKDWDFNLNKT